MSTSHFRSLCAPFMRGVVDKSRALHTADHTGLNTHQRRCLRESVGVDVRKLCDILVPDARYPQISQEAARLSGEIGVDLAQETWQSQKRFDPGRQIFHYEHVYPVGMIVNQLLEIDLTDGLSVEFATDVVSAHLRVAWITKEENDRLDARTFRYKRPDPDLAYEQAGIVLLPRLLDPQPAIADPSIPAEEEDRPRVPAQWRPAEVMAFLASRLQEMVSPGLGAHLDDCAGRRKNSACECGVASFLAADATGKQRALHAALELCGPYDFYRIAAPMLFVYREHSDFQTHWLGNDAP